MKICFAPLYLLVLASQSLASVTITTSTLPNGTVQTAYSAAIQGSGGCTPYSWAIVSGTLPAGVNWKTSGNTTSLDLTGIPTTAASYSFIVSVTGCGKHVAKKAYTVVIQSGANDVVELNWSASTSNDVAGYNIYRSPDGTNWTKINASLVASTTYSDSTVANGSTYYYAATAVDISGDESDETSPVEVVIPTN